MGWRLWVKLLGVTESPLHFVCGSVPEAGLTGLGGGFKDESGAGRVVVPSGYAGFTRTSWRAGIGGA